MNLRIPFISSFRFFLILVFSYSLLYTFFFFEFCTVLLAIIHQLSAKICFIMPSSFKEEDPRPEDEVEQNIIVIKPLSSEPVTYSTSLPSYCHGQAIFPTSMPISPVTTTTSSLPTPSFQGTSEDF